MKFLAILRDSLRETLDVKVLYVLIGLSLFTILIVGSITYRPVSVEKRFSSDAELINAIIRADPNARNLDLRFGIESFERLDHYTEPWLGDYEFDYVIRLSLPAGLGNQKDLNENLKGLRDLFSKEWFKRKLSQLFREVEVRESTARDVPPGGGAICYHVRTSGGMKIKSRREWFHEPTLFFGLLPIPVPFFPLSGIIQFIGDQVIGGFGGAVTLAISVIITAFFLPNMLSKGTVDLLLVKPIHRTTLFVYKFLGGLLFVFLNTVVIMVGLWLVVGLQTGAWLNSLLLCIFVFTFQFAILYSVSALAAVLTRSAIVCIMISFATWALCFALGWAHWGFIESKREKATDEEKRHWAFVGFDTFYAVTPRFKELDWLTSRMIETDLAQLSPEPPPPSEDREAVEEHERLQKRNREIHDQQLKDIEKRYGSYSWATSLSVSGAFILVMLALASWRFATKDY